MHFAGSNLSTDPKCPKYIYKISKNFRVEKSGEISRNLRFSRFFVPASRSDTHLGWDSWTQNRGFRLCTADVFVHLCENLIRCGASEWFFVGYTNDKKRAHGCAPSFYGWDSWTRTSDAGVKVLCLDRLGDIPSLRGIIPHPPPMCQDDLRRPAFFFWEVFEGCGELFVKSSPSYPSLFLIRRGGALQKRLHLSPHVGG